MNIPDSQIWVHLNRAGQQELYRSMTAGERLAYDKYVQEDYNRQSREYFDVPGTRNPATQAFWAPRIPLPEWLAQHRLGS
jgi:hypothetical protein